ncbi:MAG: MNIO family bufferin maturase, partial [Gammaproteobacteria bacterium]
GRPLEVLEGVRANYPIVMHGVSLSIGSADLLNQSYLRDLAGLARRFEPAWISDHLCWTGAGGRNLHDLLPLPYTEEAVKHCAQRIRQVQEFLGRRILIENISSYMQYRASRMSEAEFVGAVAEEGDCGILLDINNVYVNAFNHRFNSKEYLDELPVERIAQIHLAGHRDCGTHLLDTHDHPVSEEVWELYDYAVRRLGPITTLIEWDDRIPSFPELAAVAAQARERASFVLERERLAGVTPAKHGRDDDASVPAVK